MKCPCSMSAAELLAANTASSGDSLRSIFIEDRDGKWHVTEYSMSSAGLGSEHVTLQSAIERVETLMVKIRRDTTPPHDGSGDVVTNPVEIAQALTGKAK